MASTTPRAPRTTKATTARAKAAPKPQEDSAPTSFEASPHAALIHQTILQVLDDNKAEDIISVPLSGKSPIADFMVIATGRSSRHVTALSELIDAKLSELKLADVKLEGRENGDWVLVDAGDVVVHLFRPEVRDFYNLEKLWGVTLPVKPL